MGNLHKSFGRKKALDSVEFSVREGEIFGLLGHNGAGKSTALGIILGMISPDRGSVRISGIDVARERAWALGSVGSEPAGPRCRSSTRSVPAAVPSLTQSSSPVRPSSEEK